MKGTQNQRIWHWKTTATAVFGLIGKIRLEQVSQSASGMFARSAEFDW